MDQAEVRGGSRSDPAGSEGGNGDVGEQLDPGEDSSVGEYRREPGPSAGPAARPQPHQEGPVSV